MKKILILSMLLLVLVEIAYADITLSATAEVTPSVLTPDSYGFLKLTISNNGTTDAPSIYARVESIDPPLSFVGEEPAAFRYFGDLKSKGSTSTIYKFYVPKNASSGLYSVKFTVSQILAGAGDFKTIVQYTLISVKAPSALAVKSVAPASFKLGEKTAVTMTLSNTGAARLNNVELSWQASNDALLPFGSDNKIVLPYLDANQEVKIPVQVVAGTGITPGVHSLSIKGTYYDATGVQQSIESIIGITVGGGTTDFGVSVQQSGQTASITVANIGVNPAAGVSVKVGQSEVFLGNLNPGDYTMASMQIPVQRNATEGQPREKVMVQISYTDTVGERQVVQKEVPLGMQAGMQRQMETQAGSQQSAIPTNTLYAVIGLLALSLAIVLLRKRKPQ